MHTMIINYLSSTIENGLYRISPSLVWYASAGIDTHAQNFTAIGGNRQCNASLFIAPDMRTSFFDFVRTCLH